ncbi:MAG: cell wall protein [Enterococcus avium]
MKKVIRLFLFVLVICISTPIAEAEQVKSEAGISFYQPSNKNQTIPMEKVTMNDSKNTAPQERVIAPESGSKMYPKTNEEKYLLLGSIGVLILCLFFFVYFLKNKLNESSQENT